MERLRSGVRLLILTLLLATLPAAAMAQQPSTAAGGSPSSNASPVTLFVPLVITPPRSLAWLQVNRAGFDEHAPPYLNQEAFDLTAFDDRIYLGMEGFACARIWRSADRASAPASQADWEQVVTDGFDGTADCSFTRPGTDNDHIDSLEPFRGYLYASTAMQSATGRGTQVWRSASGNPGTWVRVNEPGFGLPNNENFKDMIEFAGLLCGGTGNHGGPGVPAGAQVWCTDGVTPDPRHPDELLWTQRNRNGFGHVENVKVWTSAVHDGALYFGVESRETDGSIWRTRNLDDPDAWEQVFEPAQMGDHGNRVDVLQGFNGHLYAGMAVPGQGVRIYRNASGDRTSWEPVIRDGFGAPSTGRLISDASAILDGVLYVSVLDHEQGVGVWRTADGLAWALAAPYGFGIPSTFAAELLAFQGDLYAWTSDYSVGQGVWRGKNTPLP